MTIVRLIVPGERETGVGRASAPRAHAQAQLPHMKLRRLQGWWGSIVSALLGCTVLTLVICVCVQLHTRLAIVALLCLLTIVVISLQGRFSVALICSVLAALGLDYFFMQPIFSLVMTRPEDIEALSTFSMIALIVSALGSKMRKSYFQLARESTERIRAEEAWREAQAQLAHVTRVATLGELAGSIAHEVNQPLTAVINNAGACLTLLPGEISKLDDVRQALSDIISEADRASAVIARIRGLIRRSPPQKSRLDLNETIVGVIALARCQPDQNEVLLRTRLDTDLPLIIGDRTQLQQVLLNLIINAIEAMSGPGHGPRELWVSSEKQPAMPAESGADDFESERRFVRDDPTKADEIGTPKVPPRARPTLDTKGAYVLVSVADSGPGLDPNSLDRLFDAFYTTKPQGLGMGLSISRSIIEAHGGWLCAKANEPKGALFQFMLPVADD
jgi:C4-dicarboxylate-specific signal transduction histidine kinase